MTFSASAALDHGYHVIVEGILHAELAEDHRGVSGFYYLDVSFAESLRRHATRPQAAEFGAEGMRGWYRHRDLLDVPGEQVIPETSTLQDTTARILGEVFSHHAARC